MKIKNKYESIKLIEELKLNVFPYIQIEKYDEQKISSFLENNKTCKFAIRDSKKSMSNTYKNNLTANEVIALTKNLYDFTITVSGLTYKQNKKLGGEVFIDSNMNIFLSVSKNCELSARDATNYPDYRISSDIYDIKIKSIPYLNYIIDYIFKYNLFNIIVEFTVFDTSVGINNEKVIIWELRTDY